MERVHLINLDSQTYEHPFDKAALNTLRNLPGFDTVTNFILNWAAVKWNLVAMQGSNFHVTRESCPELYKQIKEDAAVLGVEDFPEIYTEWGYAVNGYTTGNKDKTMLVLNSGAVDLLTRLVEDGKLRPILDPRRFTLEQVGEAHAAIEDGRAVGKVVVDIAD